MEEKKTIQPISIDAQVLLNRLKQAQPGQIIFYSELTGLIKRDVQTQPGYGACMTARNRLMRDEGMIFSPVHNHGLKRLTEEEVASSGGHGITRIRKLAGRERMKLHCGVKNFESLSNAAKIAHNTAASIYGMMQMFSKKKTIEKIETAVTVQNGKLPSAKILEMFK